jgi:hypothetical protein
VNEAAVGDLAPRSRLRIAGLLAVVIGLGLASRRWPLPGVLAEHTGDALYATAAYVGFALLAPAARTRALGAAALLFAFAIEALQLLTWPWLQQLRASRLGALLLGQGFLWADLVAYALGVGLACVADVTFRRRSIPPAVRPDRLGRP